MRIRSLLSAAASGAPSVALAAALSAALLLGGALPAVAAVNSAESSGSTTLRPAPTLVVAPGEPVLTDAKAGLTVDALLRNPTDAELPAGELLLELSVAPVKSLDALASPDGLTFTKIASGELGTTAAATGLAGEEGDAGNADSEGDNDAAGDDSDDNGTDGAAASADGAAGNDSPADTGSTPADAPADPGAANADGGPADAGGEPGEQRAAVEVDAASLPFTNTTAPGTYVLRASYIVEGADAPTAVTTTPLVWRGAGEHKIPVSVIVPFVLPANIQTMPTRAQLGDLTPGWDRLLTAAENAKATLAIDPRIIAGIRSYGVNAPQAARDLLTRLEATTSPSFLLQFGDADVAAQAALGFTSLMDPTNLEFVTRFGEFEAPEPLDPPAADSTAEAVADTEAAPAVSANADTGADAGPNGAESDASPESIEPEGDPKPEDEAVIAPPTLAELMKWNGDVAAWPAEGNVDQGTLDFLEAAKISSVVLDSGNVKHSGGPRAELPYGSAVVTDAGLGALTTEALAGRTETDRAAALTQLIGELSVRAQAGGPGVAIGLDRATVADVEDPEQILAALAELDFVRATRVADQEAGTAALKGAGALEDRLALLRSASNREAAVNEVGAVLEDPQYLSGYQRTRLLQLFATRYAPAGSGFEAAATKYRARDAELLEGVQVISTEHTQLVGASTSVPVQLHNSLPFDAIVRVNAEPISAAIDVKQRVFDDVRVAAEANERVLVPVHSRVTSGVSGIVVTVSATSGNPTVSTSTLELSISTTVETVGLWVLGVGAVVLFVAGIYRSINKRRKKAAKLAAEAVSSSME